MIAIRSDCPKTEYSEKFLHGMLSRMEVSLYKYGPIADAYPDKVSALDSLEQRLREYRRTRNTEYLIDAANFAMIEFMRPSVEGAEFVPTDADGSPGRIARTGHPTKATNSDLKP